MSGIKCPCGLRNDMETEDCKNTNCNDCCPLTRSKTNADRIRAMDDEKLADLFGQNCLCSHIQYNHSGFCESRAVCKDCIVEWLKQPAEE